MTAAAAFGSSQPTQWARLMQIGHQARAHARQISALVLLAFVICHLLAHTFLIVSIPAADEALGVLMKFWWSHTGTLVLTAALAVHLLNALWSIFIRRYLRMPAWEWAQLALGLLIPPMIMMHVIGTKISDMYLGTANDYFMVLTRHWVLSPWLAALQIAAVIVIWVHACIGLHFWWRTTRWYNSVRPFLGGLALLLPALAIAGFVAGGSETVRRAGNNPDFVANVMKHSNQSTEARQRGRQITAATFGGYLALVALPFMGRGIRALRYRMRRPPQLTHAAGRTMALLPGATVLETLRASGIPHASVCGGRGRCTTCRIRIVKGLEGLPAPAGLEADALARIAAPAGMRLACQIRPIADIAIMPLLSADAGAADGLVRGGMEGHEQLVTVVFLDLRGSTTLGEARLPYDVLFILNQFFNEMNRALEATGGHYSNFTGDGLMAIYGLDAGDPALGASQALRGASEMLRRLEQLNTQLRIELKEPLRIGIGIHYGEAIVGAMGPPRSQIVTAIGDTVNTTARLESLTKDYDCLLILSERAAEAAGIRLDGTTLHSAPVKGRSQQVSFYALREVPQTAR
jgi:adenylate cyclase